MTLTKTDLRLRTAQALIRLANDEDRPDVTEMIERVAQSFGIDAGYVAASFWELVRLGFLTVNGSLGHKLKPRVRNIDGEDHIVKGYN